MHTSIKKVERKVRRNIMFLDAEVCSRLYDTIQYEGTNNPGYGTQGFSSILPIRNISILRLSRKNIERFINPLICSISLIGKPQVIQEEVHGRKGLVREKVESRITISSPQENLQNSLYYKEYVPWPNPIQYFI